MHDAESRMPTASSEGKQNGRGFAFARREVLFSTGKIETRSTSID